jgi:hypothetical protein
MFQFIALSWLTLFTLFCGHFMISGHHQTPLHLILHPFTLGVSVLFACLFLKDLFSKGTRLSSVHRCINQHLAVMSHRHINQAWDGLSFDLRTKLTNQIRLTHGGKAFFGKKRMSHYAIRFAQIYQNGKLRVDSIHLVKQTRSPRTMYMVRLKSRSTHRVRMTIWISQTKSKKRPWGIDEICIHPKSGDTQKGDTLTGTRIKSAPKVKKSSSLPTYQPNFHSARLTVVHPT